MKNWIKVDYYDRFNCIADQCSFPCCIGWDISIDPDTYMKWMRENNQPAYFSENIKSKKRGKTTEYSIKMGLHKCCPFFNKNGLCNIVTDFSDDYLTKTCRTFPRQENNFGEWSELSLSASCPAVVDLMNGNNGSRKLLYEGDEQLKNYISVGYRIREAMLYIIQNDLLSLKDRILLIFYMLISIRTSPNMAEELVQRSQDETYLLSLASLWSEEEMNSGELLEETKELFLDLTLNYRDEKYFKKYLHDISEVADDLDVEDAIIQWNQFKTVFKKYDTLMENYIVSNIFANCISDDIDDMIISFQIAITEYCMIRYSSLLKWTIDKNTDYSDIRDYIVVYSRMIGYNGDGIREFWEESFDEAIWEFGYLYLLVQ